jgi:Spy/CpxP family protein refolding chaperone
MRLVLLAACAALFATPATAQHGGHSGHQPATAPQSNLQPYAGQQSRAVASLSAEEIQGYLEAHGMGFAKSAELNGYPGPMHVLELDKELALTDAQRARVKAVMDAMKAKGRALGAKYVAAETAVDAAFKANAPARVIARRVAAAETLRHHIRMAHLAAHIEITPLLSADQRKRYAELRGYGGAHERKH